MLNTNHTTTTYHGNPGKDQFNGHLNSYPNHSQHIARSPRAKDGSLHSSYSLGFPYTGSNKRNTQGSFVTRIHTDGVNHLHNSESTSDGNIQYQSPVEHMPVNATSRHAHVFNHRQQNSLNNRKTNSNPPVRGVNGSDFLR